MRRLRVYCKRVAIVTAILLLAGVASAFVATQYKPTWFRRPQLSNEQLSRARCDMVEMADRMGDQLVRGTDFDLHLDQQQINNWLAAVGENGLELDDIPIGDSIPVVRFEQDRLRIGAVLERNGWRAVVHATCSIALATDGRSLKIEIASISCGAVPVSLGLVRRWLLPALMRWAPSARRDSSSCVRLLDQEVCGLEGFLDGVTLPNRFVWPNGKRAFRLRSLRVSGERLGLTIEPL